MPCVMINNLSLDFKSIITFDNLFNAYLCARKGKRHKRYVLEFELNLGKNLSDLYNDLINHTYRPKPCREFDIWCKAGQKQRHITAPNFRDLIVEFCVYNAIYNAFDKTLIHDSYGCRRGKGTSHCADRCHQFVRRYNSNLYYLQIDIRKYYYSLDHKILKHALNRVIKDTDVLDLIMMFISNRERGVNVGSLIAQFCGIIYLNQFDHYVKRVLKIKSYLRYVDDMVFIGLTRQQAIELKDKCEVFLKTYLNLNYSHWKIDKLSHGVNFVGYRAYRKYRIVRKRTIYSFCKAIKKRNYNALESLLAMAFNSASYKFLIQKLDNHCKYPNHILRRVKQWLSIPMLKPLSQVL